MSDQWETYPCTLASHPAFITVNTGFAARAASCPHPHLATFRIAIQAPSDRGFPQPDEFEPLHELEAQLCALIEPEHGLHVGRITSDGHRDIVFYVSASKSACLRILDDVATPSCHEMSLNYQADAGLAPYWEGLYPTLLAWQIIKDRRLEDTLERQGDPLTQPRDIEHWAFFPSIPAREALLTRLADAADLAFTVRQAHELDEPSDTPHVLRLAHHGLPDHVSMRPYTAWLAHHCHELGGRYDGWETEVLKPARPHPLAEEEEAPLTATQVFNGLAKSMAEQLVDLIQAGAYDAAQDLMNQVTEDERERYVYGFACHEGAVFRAARWASACPHSAYALLTLGASMIVTGWQVRGSGYAEDVAQEAWVPFLDSLGDAREPLERAARLAPSMADPFGWMIQREMGRGTNLDTVRALFEQGVQRSRWHWPVHMKFAAASTDKWYGSHGFMMDFALAASAQAPALSNVHMLVPCAYAELALDKEAQATESLHSDVHAQHVRQALYRWLDATPDDLQMKLLNTYGPFSTMGVNHFAVACYLTGAHHEARILIQALYGSIESLPWAWIAEGQWERRNVALVHDRVARELGL